MRKLLPALLAIALLCALCGCGGSQSQTKPEDTGNSQASEPAAAPAAQPVEEPEDLSRTEAPAEEPEAPAEEVPEEAPPVREETPAAQPGTPPAAPEDGGGSASSTDTSAPAEEAPAGEEAPAPRSAEELKAIAEGLVGRPVSELYAAIGKPLSSDYAPSCLIDGEDGELTYSGFVVYTERGADYETVYAVF